MDYREINSLIAKYIKERNNPKAIGKEFREALITAENALRELKRFYLAMNLLKGDNVHGLHSKVMNYSLHSINTQNLRK